MKIIFEAHATTIDNEAGVASGWNDVALSPLGENQARELGERYKDTNFDAVFTADLQRAYNTARLAFPDIEPEKLFIDWRLRECNYGDLTLASKKEVDVVKGKYVTEPFPNGESYEQTMRRMGSFIEDLKVMGFKTVLVIGSRATHYGFDHHVDGKSIADCVATKFTWQPGWKYELQ